MGSNPTECNIIIYGRSYSVVVSTPDFESGILGSNPGKTKKMKTWLAQSVERTPFKRVVVGSSPTSGEWERWTPRKDRQ